MEFTLKIQEIVVPSPASPVHVVTLSNNDQIMPPYYTSFLYFFPSSSSSPPQTLPLKLSLARALAAFPAVSGRLKPRSSNGTRVDVDCSNQGAVFVEAHTPTTLQHLLTTGNGDVRGSGMYQPSPLWKLLAPNPYEESVTDKPLLFTQLTRLGCGGVVVAVSLHHLVADGAAQAHFVASWGELARGEAIAALPHLGRACMSARTPPCPSFAHHEYITVPNQPVPSSPPSDNPTDPPPPMTSRIFEFLPRDMQLLKERANAEADGGDVYTGFQALVAHMWKHITKARGTDPAQEIKLGWAVDGRKRFKPPLPPHYFGNVNFYGCSAATAGEVMDEEVGSTAGRIQAGTQRITDEYMRSALDLIEREDERAVTIMASFISPADLAVTSWQQFAAYDMDWGWGRPIFFAPAVYDFTGLVILLPHPLRGLNAVNALVGMPLRHMQALLSDADFYPVTPA